MKKNLYTGLENYQSKFTQNQNLKNLKTQKNQKNFLPLCWFGKRTQQVILLLMSKIWTRETKSILYKFSAQIQDILISEKIDKKKGNNLYHIWKNTKQLGFICRNWWVSVLGLKEEPDGQKQIFSSWNKISSKKTYETNFGSEPFGDITKVEASDIPDHDILWGFPSKLLSCQPQKRFWRYSRHIVLWCS